MDRNFDREVLRLVSIVPSGKITTYGEIARVLHTSPRAVGQALRRNPRPVEVPCHRVVRSDGSLGGYAGIENSMKKAQLLQKEGVCIEKNRIANFETALYNFRILD